LTARATLNQSIDEDGDVQALQKCNDSVNRTRAPMPWS
jgi:hypothetical protein